MDLGTLSAPNRFTFERFTATALWQPLGADSYFHFGSIDSQTADEGISREKVDFKLDGNVDLAYDEVVSIAPVLTLKGKQFHSTILPLLLMGEAGADTSQASNGSATRTIAGIVRSKTYDLGGRNLSSLVAMKGATLLVAGIDYFFDAGKGLFRIAETSVNVATGDTVILTWAQPLLTREVYTAFKTLNSLGTLLLLLMDEHWIVPVVEMRMPGSISRDKANDGDPLKTNQWALRFALEGQPTVLRLAEFDELLFDDGSIVEFA